jgi:hypothetical protein
MCLVLKGLVLLCRAVLCCDGCAVRVASLNPITLAYANNVKITTSTGYQYTYVFTD